MWGWCERVKTEISIDYRYLDAPLRSANDPKLSLGSFAVGVRLGPGVRMPRLLALHCTRRRGDGDSRTKQTLWRGRRNRQRNGAFGGRTVRVVERMCEDIKRPGGERSGAEADGGGGQAQIPRVDIGVTRCFEEREAGRRSDSQKPIRRYSLDQR